MATQDVVRKHLANFCSTQPVRDREDVLRDIAHQLYLKRGSTPGSATEDYANAERLYADALDQCEPFVEVNDVRIDL